MYGDILAYHETFKESENNNITTYEQRAAELKSRLKRSHIIRMGSNNQSARNNKGSFWNKVFTE